MKPNLEDHDELLIWLFIFIDSLFAQTELPLYTERLSNNRSPFFTDAELIPWAVFAELIGCKNKKQGYLFVLNHYATWFPKLPKYEVYNRKLNKFHEALADIFMVLRNKYCLYRDSTLMIDTAPITVCQAQHAYRSKAAQPFVSKGYCSAKKKYYIGTKLQIIAQQRKDNLPFPVDYHIEPAEKHDLEIAKQTLPDSGLENIDLYGDKASIDQNFQLDLFENQVINLITPIKKKKGQSELTLFQRAYNTIHPSIRQPVDSLFAWINDQTKIQNASKVRSVDGLFFHVNVKMDAALLILIISG